jgi:beta-phosphoglucomutase family hydrolase
MEAVIFDMDGVIVDNSKYHRLAWEQYIEKKGLHADKKKLYETYGMRNIELIKIIFGDGISQQEAEIIGKEKEQVYRDIYLEAIKPAKGLIPYLQFIKEKNLKTAIATSACIENVDFTIDNLGIREYFDVIVSEKDVTEGKPHPDVYLKAAKKLGVSPTQCLVIEDAVAGVEAGKRAGAFVAAVTTTHVPSELNSADIIIDNFYDKKIKDIIQTKR